VFNRPLETRLVFEKIREAKPRVLLIISDGPRAHVPGEAEKNLAVLQIASNVDWECTVYKNISSTNLGCRRRLQSGLDWVFEQVDFAVILEDDCLPAPGFFPFMNTMLEEYKDSDRIGMVSGDNFLWPARKQAKGYYFSSLPHIWGWGTWARSWKLYEPNADSWLTSDKDALLKSVFPYKVYQNAWKEILDTIDEVNTWDYQWCYAMWKHEMLSVVPNANLITNIGLNAHGTHTLDDNSHYQNPAGSLKIPHKSKPPRIKRSKAKDLIELTVMRAHSAKIIGLSGVTRKILGIVSG
jgi:hypothetical protein